MNCVHAVDGGLSGQNVLDLVDRVYAAAAAEAGWEETLEDIGLAARFDGLALVRVDRATRQPETLVAVGLGQCRKSGRRLVPPSCNPFYTDAVLGSKPGAIWFDHEVLAPPLWAETAFATAWMAPQCLVNWGCVSLTGNAERVILLEVYGSAARAPIGGEACRLLGRLAPHLSRAWRIGGIDLPRPTGSLAETGPATTVAGLSHRARLRARFGLTKAEARLALHLAAGRSLACAAETFGVRLSTLRSQLTQVYAKTGTNRQVELVALLHRTELASGRTWVDTQNRLSA